MIDRHRCMAATRTNGRKAQCLNQGNFAVTVRVDRGYGVAPIELECAICGIHRNALRRDARVTNIITGEREPNQWWDNGLLYGAAALVKEF